MVKINKITGSSWIQGLSYNTKSRELTIQTTKGQIYTYDKVAPKTYTILVNAKSVGSAVSSFIQGRK